MKHLKKDSPKGQAMSEMVVAIPLLLLLAAGVIQFSLIFQAKTQFDHACGEAARQYAAGLLRTDYAFNSVIWANLKPRQNYFIHDSLKVFISKTSAHRDQLLSGRGQFLQAVSKTMMNYEGDKWTVVIRLNPPPYFGVIFPNGVPFSSTLAVLRHPSTGTLK